MITIILYIKCKRVSRGLRPCGGSETIGHRERSRYNKRIFEHRSITPHFVRLRRTSRGRQINTDRTKTVFIRNVVAFWAVTSGQKSGFQTIEGKEIKAKDDSSRAWSCYLPREIEQRALCPRATCWVAITGGIKMNQREIPRPELPHSLKKILRALNCPECELHCMQFARLRMAHYYLEERWRWFPHALRHRHHPEVEEALQALRENLLKEAEVLEREAVALFEEARKAKVEEMARSYMVRHNLRWIVPESRGAEKKALAQGRRAQADIINAEFGRCRCCGDGGNPSTEPLGHYTSLGWFHPTEEEVERFRRTGKVRLWE